MTRYAGYPTADCWGAVLIVALVWGTTLPLVVKIGKMMAKEETCVGEHERTGLLG